VARDDAGELVQHPWAGVGPNNQPDSLIRHVST